MSDFPVGKREENPACDAVDRTEDSIQSDEARYRWIVMAAIFSASAMSVSDRIAWSNISIFYAQTFGTSVAALGSFFSAFYVGYFVTNGAGGFGVDWLGGRRMLVSSLTLLGAATFGFGLTRSITAGLAVQCAMGFVAGLDYSACMRLLSDVFPPGKKATAIGVFLASIPVGLTLPNLFIPAVLRSIGWEGVYKMLGVASIIVAVCVYLALGKRSSYYAQRTGSPKPAPLRLLKKARYRTAAIAGFGQQWGIWGFAFWSNALLIKGHHIDAVKAGYIIALFGAAAGVAKPIAGILIDRTRMSKAGLAAFICFLFSIALASFGTLGTTSTFALLSALVGIAAGSSGVLNASLVVETAGAEYAGSGTGLANAFWILGNVLVPLLVGAIFQYFQSFEFAILALAAGPATSALCFAWLARMPTESSCAGLPGKPVRVPQS